MKLHRPSVCSLAQSVTLKQQRRTVLCSESCNPPAAITALPVSRLKSGRRPVDKWRAMLPHCDP